MPLERALQAFEALRQALGKGLAGFLSPGCLRAVWAHLVPFACRLHMEPPRIWAPAQM